MSCMEQYCQYELIVLNLLTNERFTKYIENEYLLRKFRDKCKYSKKVKIVAEIKRW